ncbi:hypothetical protein LTR41_006236 [Exophiala xenobiotica]|nr:hypothetical protein LTR41_006236 [Exophiala xenobiotica]
MVDRFSKEGHRVIVIDLNKEKGEQRAKTDSNLHFIHADVTRRETWEEALEYGRRTFGRLDVVVNNAEVQPVHQKPIEQYEKTFNLNVKVATKSCNSGRDTALTVVRSPFF